jgi:phospholipid/cholesterol/gamma-HCH transport system permease protein
LASNLKTLAGIEHAISPDGVMTLTLSGEWSVRVRVPSADAALRELGGTPPVRHVVITVTDLDRWDSALLAFLLRIEAVCQSRGVSVDRGNLPDGIKRLLDLAGPVDAGRAGREQHPSLVTRVGFRVLAAAASTVSGIRLIGELAIGFARWLRAAADLRRTDLIAMLQQCGVEALPIATVIALLVGMILAFVGAIQLSTFGADIYVADLVAVAMLREMAPIMTGIVLAGRTGAAFAAQIAAMQSNEEIDALSTLGIRPAEFLVLPRVIALALMTPFLCLYADAAGILGGFIVALSSLNVTPEAYLVETQGAATVTHMLIGLAKGAVFGVLVGITGCHRGLTAARSAEGVGNATTSAVVSGILQIIIADAIFAVALNVLGI